jgi:hypothetical protein
LSLLLWVLLAGPASAARPDQLRVPVDDLFVDPFLTSACGVEVTVHATGHAIFRALTDADDNVTHEVNNFAIDLTYSSESGAIHAKDVGADRVTYFEDGSFVDIIIGSVQSFSIPGEGRVYADVGRSMLEVDASGNSTFTPLGGQHDTDQTEMICEFLGA